MPQFKLDGLKLKIPQACMNDNIRDAITRGSYEGNETLATKRHVEATDRVLDLGGGAGYVAFQAARITGAANVTTVEASPAMFKAIGESAEKNGLDELRALHGAVVPDSHPEDTVNFEVLPGFWASSVAVDGEKKKKASKLVSVPAMKFSDLQEIAQPTVVTMDIEGAEADLAKAHWYPSVRIVIMEIHPQSYGLHGLRQLISDMFANGFGLMPWGTRGSVMVFKRLDPPPS
ncbi:FkbM family methyltransferase [Aliiroseovarius sp. S253]|uniref:FkbM family methyltransferase n=1 Tax=Aliiroseovarius sp. S253 TaxID=3415133 RepID=UPI003C7D0888